MNSKQIIHNYAITRDRDTESETFVIDFQYEQFLEKLNSYSDRIQNILSLIQECEKYNIHNYPTRYRKVRTYDSHTLKNIDSIGVKIRGIWYYTDGKTNELNVNATAVPVDYISSIMLSRYRLKACKILVYYFPLFEKKFLDFIESLRFGKKIVHNEYSKLSSDEFISTSNDINTLKDMIYLCLDKNVSNEEKQELMNIVVQQNRVPVFPELHLNPLDTDYHTDLHLWEPLLYFCDECWVIGNDISDGMKDEINFAIDNQIPLKKYKNFIDVKKESIARNLSSDELSDDDVSMVYYEIPQPVDNTGDKLKNEPSDEETFFNFEGDMEFTPTKNTNTPDQ